MSLDAYQKAQRAHTARTKFRLVQPDIVIEVGVDANNNILYAVETDAHHGGYVRSCPQHPFVKEVTDKHALTPAKHLTPGG
jgi:hypothetical protein